MASGFPFNVTQSGDSENNDGLWERPDLVPGQAVGVANQTPNHWFNTAAFQRAVLHYGTSPRDPLVGPGTDTLDLSASKSFKMPRGEARQVMFRGEFFNAFNYAAVLESRQFAGNRHLRPDHWHGSGEPPNPAGIEVYVLRRLDAPHFMRPPAARFAKREGTFRVSTRYGRISRVDEAAAPASSSSRSVRVNSTGRPSRRIGVRAASPEIS